MQDGSTAGPCREGRRTLTRFDGVVMVLFAGICAWLYGRLFPKVDFIPPLASAFFRVARIGFPLGVAAVVGCYWGLRTRRIHPYAIVLATFVLVVTVPLALAVASSRYAARSQAALRAMYHPYLQLSPRPVALPDPKGDALWVFCLGGSTTEFTDGDGRGWPERVEAILQRECGGRPVRVFNMGRQWYTSLHVLIYYETLLREHHPDAIVFMEAINDLLHNADFSDFSQGPFREDYGHFLGPLSRFITRRSLLRQMGAEVAGVWAPDRRVRVESSDFPGLVPYRRNLGTLIDLAERDGTRVILMTQPTLLKEGMTPEEESLLLMVNTEAVGPSARWTPRTAREGMRAYNAVIREVAAERGAYLIDLEATLPRDTRHFCDEVHYRSEGFEVVAAQVSRELERALDLPCAGTGAAR